jgi:uncharacterized cupredoxin-like copper-binding protein
MTVWAPARRFLVVVGCVALLAGCGDEELGPYVSVAVDNHFHDIHRKNDIEIDSERGFVVKNQGSNLHNVTIAGTDINEDVEPGDELSFDPVGEFLEPGTYDVICKYHDSVGMVGRFTVVD